MKDIAAKSVTTLIAAANDDSDEVRAQVVTSFRILAAKDMIAVVDACADWLTNNKPSSGAARQREVMCRVVIEILKAHAGPNTVPTNVLNKLLHAAFDDMTALTDYNSTWAMEACALYVDLCDLSPQAGMAILLEAIPANGVPHYFTMQALTDFATASPLRFLPHLKDVLAKLLPILGNIKQDNHRLSVATSIGAFGDAILQLAQREERQQAAAAGTDTATEDGAAPLEPLTPRSAECGKLARCVFADGAQTAVSFLINEWARISEQRVRGPVMFAITAMSVAIDDEARATMLPKIVTLLAAALKREKPRDLPLIARGCPAVTSCVSDTFRAAMLPQLEPMLSALLATAAGCAADKEFHTAAAGPVHQALAHLMQWSESIAAASMDAVVSFASKTLDAKTGSKDPWVRATVLRIVKHVVANKSLAASVDPFKDHIIAAVKLTVSDTDWRVRRMLVATITAMATTTLVPFMEQVGAKDLVHYLVKNAAVHDSVVAEFNAKPAPIGTSPEEVRETCRGTLVILASTQHHLDGVLWPGLMDHMSLYASDPELLEVFPSVCRCLVPLAERRGQTEEFYVDFRVSVNLPKPGALVSIFAAHLMQHPSEGVVRESALRQTMAAMEAIAPLLDEPFLYAHMDEVPSPIAELWSTSIPEMRTFLAEQQPTALAWEELTCKLVSRTVTARQEAEWVEQIASCAIALLPALVSSRRLHLYRAMLTVIGIALSKSPRREFVSTNMQEVLDAIDPDVSEYRVGAAKLLSYVAGNKDYVDLVLERLTLMSKPPEKKGFFASFGNKDKQSTRKVSERSRAVAAMGACYSARRMPQTVVGSRLDSTIVPLLSSVLGETPDPEVRGATLQAFPLLEQPLKKLAGAGYVFKARDGLIEKVLVAATSSMAGGGGAAPAKGGADPAVASAQNAIAAVEAATTLITSITAPPLAGGTIDKITALAISTFPTARFPTEQIEAQAQTAVCALLAAVLQNNEHINIDAALEPFNQLTASPDHSVRVRAFAMYAAVIKAAALRIDTALRSEDGTVPPVVVTVGSVLARLVPRVVDAVPEMRKAAADAMSTVIKLHSVVNPDVFPADSTLVAASVKELKAIRTRAVALDLTPTANRAIVDKELTAVNKALCAVVVGVLPQPEHFVPTLNTLLSAGLNDPQPDPAACCCVVLHGMVRGMGALLSDSQAQEYLLRIVAAASSVLDRESTLQTLLVSVRNLAKHHKETCFSALLKSHEVPHAPHVVKSIQAIAGDSALSKPFLNFCLDMMLNSAIYEDRPSGKGSVRDLAPGPISAACVFGWAGEVPKCEPLLTEMRSNVLCVLLLYLSEAHSGGPAVAPKAGLVAQSMKLFIHAVSSDVTRDRMERYGWARLCEPAYFTVAGAEVIKYWAEEDEHGEELTTDGDRDLELTAEHGLGLAPMAPTQTIVEVAEFIIPYADKPNANQRTVAVALCGAMLRTALGEDALMQSLITALLGRTGPDEHPGLRHAALSSFEHLLCHEYANIQGYLSAVFSALLSNFDDMANPEIVLAAMTVLYQFMDGLTDKSQVKMITVNVMLKLKVKFEHADARMRTGVLELFGAVVDLALQGYLDTGAVEQQVHIHLVTLIAHIEDDSVEVRKASKLTFARGLRLIAERTKNDDVKRRVTDMLSKPHMDPDAARCNYDELLNDFSLLWVAHFAGRINDLFTATMAFFESPRVPLRLAAAAVAGSVLKQIPPEELSRTNAEQVCGGLMRLAHGNERSVEVRVRAVRALGFLPVV